MYAFTTEKRYKLFTGYQVIELIGTTSGNKFYRARRHTDQEPVILKLFPPNLGALARQEYEFLRQLNVAGVAVPIAMVDANGNASALVLKNIAGESFEAYLRRAPLEFGTALRLACGLACTLSNLHATHVVHHNLRPAHFLADAAHGTLWLIDVSALTRQPLAPIDPEQWPYLAPEQTGRMKHTIDERSDLYSLGVILYRLFTGNLPFEAGDAIEWAHCHIARMPRAPAQRYKGVDETVSNIVMKLLAKAPDDRYQSAHGLLQDLKRCLDQWQEHGRIEPFALAAHDLPERLQIPQKLYGRYAEVARLIEAFERVAEHGPLELVLVAGYSGVGKSSLVQALHKPVIQHRGYFISGKFEQYKRDIPYAIITQAFSDLIRQVLGESEASIAAWRQRLQQALGHNGQLMIDIIPQLELIIGPQPPVAELSPKEAQQRFHTVFEHFVGVFATPKHPLALFLDDLQWLDAASLRLLEYLAKETEMRHLLCIGAYRDNEVDTAHPLTAALEAIRQSQAHVTEIKLISLSFDNMNQLVGDALHIGVSACEPLARLVHERTQGNPFFFIQFLNTLHREGLLQWNVQEQGWRWNLAQIKAWDLADNVVDLMAGKLRRLPKPVQKTLELAACLGNRFELVSLALASGISPVEAERRLHLAAREDLILLTNGIGKFLHDRIQQAAYSLIPQKRRSEVHLRICRALLDGMTEATLTEHLFDVVNQLNLGAALLAGRDEKAWGAELNLRAGCKAKTAMAYTSALKYFAIGASLLAEDRWEYQYKLSFQLEIYQAECEFLTGALEAAEQRLAILWERAANVVDQASVTSLRMDLYITFVQSHRAVAVCLDYFRQLGIEWSPHPTKMDVLQEYKQLWQRLERGHIEDLINLPVMDDPTAYATMELLCRVTPAAMYTDENLMCLIILRGVNLSLAHGNSDASTDAYVSCGMILGPYFNDYPAGFRFGQLACNLVSKRGLDGYKGRVYARFGHFVAPWTQPLRCVQSWARRGFKAATRIGDLTYTSFNSYILVANMLACGDPLVDIDYEVTKGLALARETRFGIGCVLLLSQQRLIKMLRGLTTDFTSFNAEDFNEADFEQHLEENPSLCSPACRYWIRKLQGRFLAGDYTSALETAEKARVIIWTIQAFLEHAEYHFYAALTHAASCNTPVGQCTRHQQALVEHLQQLTAWAEHCPENFKNRQALVAAELARLEGRMLDAENLYEQAINSAHDNGFIHNEGIAHELAAQFFLTRGLSTAGNAHLARARECFAQWGAEGKVRQLEARYPQLQALYLPAAIAVMGNPGAQLDLLSITKASQAISGHIVLSELVNTLLHAVLENAGAQNGTLLLMRNDDLILAAKAQMAEPRVQVRQYLKQAPPSPLPLPASILNYVRRSREPVLLADATQSQPFASDIYFESNQPKSVLCLPILRQDALLGMLYLENRLISHAFTPAHLTVLELLAAQAAISLENALLYSELREREARIRRLVDSNIIGVMFWTLDGAIYDANDAFLKMLGYSREAVQAGQVRWTDLTPPEYFESDAREIEKIKRYHSIPHYEKEFIRYNGSRVPVLLGAAFLEGSTERGVAFVLDLTEQKQAEARIRYMAHYDPLTGLPNRMLLQDRVQQAINYAQRDGTQIAVLFLDLDHFKHINDSLGHSIGDRLLQQIAARLRQCLREGDSVTRWGGDEFVLCLPTLTRSDDAALTAQKVLETVNRPYLVDEHELHITGSIGISVYPNDGSDVESLMRAADMAMYHAKEQGRGNCQFFTPALNQAARQRLDLINRLSQALANQELMVYYQPKVNLETGQIVSAEALLRWRQASTTPVSCSALIAIAEETGLILPIGEWVLREACQQLRQWHAAGHSELSVAVNLSPRQLYQNGFLDTIERILRETGVPPSALDLEITEGLLMRHNDAGIATLNQLGAMGIQLSVDDFGTGYSNLSYLHRFPIDTLNTDFHRP